MKRLFLRYPIRPASRSERHWFARNRSVAAYAAHDDSVVLNPELTFSARVRRSLYINEAIRIYFRRNRIVPDIRVTAAQKARFQSTPYAKNARALKQTLVARIAAKDPSAGRITAEQRGYAACLVQILSNGRSQE